MVRPIRRDEQDEAQYKFGDLGGYMGGGSNFAATGGGQFSGDGQGTGFVNATDYLSANKGKGAALGEEITSDATAATDGFNAGVDDLTGTQIGWEAPTDDPFRDTVNNPLEGEHSVRIGEKKNANTGRLPGRIGGANAPGNQVVLSKTVKGRSAGEFQEAEDHFSKDPNKYKGPSESDIDGKYSALDQLRIGDPLNKKPGLNDLLKTYDPNSETGRTLRESKLDDKAKSSGISYGSGSRGFDAMFMEAENPNLFKSKYDNLDAALKRFNGLGEVADTKKGEIRASTAKAGAYDDDLQAAAASEREKAIARAAEAGKEKSPAVTPKPVLTNPDGSIARPPDASGGSAAPYDPKISSSPDSWRTDSIKNGDPNSIPSNGNVAVDITGGQDPYATPTPRRPMPSDNDRRVPRSRNQYSR